MFGDGTGARAGAGQTEQLIVQIYFGVASGFFGSTHCLCVDCNLDEVEVD